MNLVRRGRCLPRQAAGKTYYHITIPAGATEAKKTLAKLGGTPDLFMQYYVSHELCHAYQYERDGRMGHNETFYTALRKVITPEMYPYEIDYKPSARKYLIA